MFNVNCVYIVLSPSQLSHSPEEMGRLRSSRAHCSKTFQVMKFHQIEGMGFFLLICLNIVFKWS